MRNEGTSKSQGRPKCKKNASLEAAAGQNAKQNASLETEAGQNAKKMQKKHKKKQKQRKKNAKKKHANATGNGQFFSFLMISAMTANCCMFFAFFCVFFLCFGRPLFPGLHFFCILAGRRFQACVFFAFWSSLGFRCASFSHFAGPRPLQPRKCKKNAKQNSSTPVNTKKMQSKIQAGQQTRKKKRKQQMQKKCNTKNMQTADAKKTQNKCKT